MRYLTETAERLRKSLRFYAGPPFLCNEYARFLDVSWKKMHVALQQLEALGEVERVYLAGTKWTFYRKRPASIGRPELVIVAAANSNEDKSQVVLPTDNGLSHTHGDSPTSTPPTTPVSSD